MSKNFHGKQLGMSNCNEQISRESMSTNLRVKPPRSPSHREVPHFLKFLPLGALLGSHNEYEKKKVMFSTGKKEINHVKIFLSILLFLTSSGLRRNYFPVSNLLGFY